MNNWHYTRQLFNQNQKTESKSMLAILQDCGHLVWQDVALLLLLEFRILYQTGSFEQLFRSQYYIQLSI